MYGSLGKQGKSNYSWSQIPYDHEWPVGYWQLMLTISAQQKMWPYVPLHPTPPVFEPPSKLENRKATRKYSDQTCIQEDDTLCYHLCLWLCRGIVIREVGMGRGESSGKLNCRGRNVKKQEETGQSLIFWRRIVFIFFTLMNVGYNSCNLDRLSTNIFMSINFSLKMLEQAGIPKAA